MTNKPAHIAKIVLVLFILCASHRIIAQTEALRFEHITMENGLSSNRISKIFQDRKGFIWIGTYDGLNKYDGYSFTSYKFDPLDSTSISQNFVYNIWEDQEGFIWATTFEGLCKFDRATEQFTRYKPDPRSKFSDPNIFAINEDNTGVLWLGGASGQLARFDKKDGKFYDETFDLGFRKRAGELMVHDGVICIYKSRDGILWVGNTVGLHKLTIQPANDGQRSRVLVKSFQHEPGNPNSLGGKIVSSVLEDKKGVLWIATDSGLFTMDRKTDQFKRFLNDPKNPHSISTDNLTGWGFGRAMVEDPDSNLWIVSNKGLHKLNRDRTSVISYHFQSSNPAGLNSATISSLYIDRSGILWVGTPFRGLNKANLNQKSFGLKQYNPDSRNSLSNNQVTAIVEDQSGIIWIGTDGGGLNRWDKKNDQFTNYRYDPKYPASLRSDYVNAILEDKEGNLWICNGDWLSLMNKQTGNFKHFNTNPKGFQDLDHKTILAIDEDRDGLIWLGTGNGVKFFDRTADTFRHYYHNPADTTGISDYTAQAVFADSRNNIWVGYGSIATDRFDKKTGKIFHYKHDPGKAESISSNIITSFYEDPKGDLWLATWGGGLCRYDHSTDKFISYTDKQGLADNAVHSLLEDDQHNLWLGTANGLSRFEPAKGIFTNYDYTDGLASNFFAAGHRDRPSSFKGKDGVLYFGGDNGLIYFDPAAITAGSKSAPVVITHFRLFDSLVKGANEAKEIVLKHNENYFSFEFASLSYYNPGKNLYAYKLEGVDKDWVYSRSRRYAGYTDIGPGKYTFKVIATNNDGIWNEDGVSVSIIIRPPWWRTWWAYAIYGLLLIAAGVGGHRYQKQKVIQSERERAQKRELAQAKEIEKAYHQLKETQAQLVQQEKMASLGELTAGIAHEIQNPLNFVNNFSDVNKELLSEMKEEMDKGNIEDAKAIASNVIDNEGKINHHGRRADAIVKGMLQHSRTSSGQKEPTDINALCDEYLRLAYHGLRAKDKSFNAVTKTEFDNSIGKINVVSQDIGRVILNLINNAFYAVAEKRKQNLNGYEPTIVVSTSKIPPLRGRGAGIEIKVKDNGNGIPQKVLDKIFQPFFTTKPTGVGTGLGLSLAYDIITKGHGGELKVETKEGEGSEFTIIILS